MLILRIILSENFKFFEVTLLPTRKYTQFFFPTKLLELYFSNSCIFYVKKTIIFAHKSLFVIRKCLTQSIILLQ